MCSEGRGRGRGKKPTAKKPLNYILQEVTPGCSTGEKTACCAQQSPPLRARGLGAPAGARAAAPPLPAAAGGGPVAASPATQPRAAPRGCRRQAPGEVRRLHPAPAAGLRKRLPTRVSRRSSSRLPVFGLRVHTGSFIYFYFPAPSVKRDARAGRPRGRQYAHPRGPSAERAGRGRQRQAVHPAARRGGGRRRRAGAGPRHRAVAPPRSGEGKGGSGRARGPQEARAGP